MSEKKIKIGNKLFKENCRLKINDREYRLRFIDVGHNTCTIELENLNDPNNFKIIGQWTNGQSEFGSDMFHAELVSED